MSWLVIIGIVLLLIVIAGAYFSCTGSRVKIKPAVVPDRDIVEQWAEKEAHKRQHSIWDPSSRAFTSQTLLTVIAVVPMGEYMRGAYYTVRQVSRFSSDPGGEIAVPQAVIIVFDPATRKILYVDDTPQNVDDTLQNVDEEAVVRERIEKKVFPEAETLLRSIQAKIAEETKAKASDATPEAVAETEETPVTEE